MGHGDTKLSLSVWARNMFNEAHIFRRDPSNSLPAAPTTSLSAGSIANILGDYGNFNAPRTFGLEASIKL
jgi:iron complex outermembrane receptor protein